MKMKIKMIFRNNIKSKRDKIKRKNSNFTFKSNHY